MSLLIIFLLLYVVYHSAKEAAHVILAVPFALSGSVFLQYALGYNFSVAVQALYRFFWNELCDLYVEASKAVHGLTR